MSLYTLDHIMKLSCYETYFGIYWLWRSNLMWHMWMGIATDVASFQSKHGFIFLKY